MWGLLIFSDQVNHHLFLEVFPDVPSLARHLLSVLPLLPLVSLCVQLLPSWSVSNYREYAVNIQSPFPLFIPPPSMPGSDTLTHRRCLGHLCGMNAQHLDPCWPPESNNGTPDFEEPGHIPWGCSPKDTGRVSYGFWHNPRKQCCFRVS